MHYAVCALELRVLYCAYAHAALLRRAAHQPVGQQRHPQPGGHRVHQRLSAGALPGRFHGEPVRLQHALRHRAGSAALLAHQQGVFQHLLKAHTVPQRAVGRRYQRQPVAPIGLRRQLGGGLRALHQRHVQLVAQQRPLQLRAVVYAHAHAQPRVFRLKPAHYARKVAVAYRARGPHAQHARGVPVEQALFHLAKRIVDMRRVAVQLPRAVGGVQPPPQPLEQLHPVVALQLLYRARYRRLHHVQLLGRARHAQRAVYREEHPYMPYGHASAPLFIAILLSFPLNTSILHIDAQAIS